MNLSLWDTPSEYFQLEHPRRSFPVMPSLTVKSKGEAPKCKTCIYFECAHCCMKPMGMACEDYKRKKKKK